MQRIVFFTLLWFVCFSTLSSVAATVEGVRMWRSPDSTRLVFDLDAPVTHKIFKLDNPKRLVIDVEQGKFSAPLSALDFSDTPVTKLRHGAKDGGALRIVLDLKSDVKPRSFALKQVAEKPNRLVVDLYDQEQKTVKSVESITKQSEAAKRRDIVIAIDAGHGGEDPGAIGPGRLYEKHIVLKVAKNLANVVNAAPGYKATLVRESDYFIPLYLRPEAARKEHADLFVSIHADGFDDPSARGASVFTLSNRGASSKMASILASKENQSDLIGGVDRISLDDKDSQLRQILVDLSMTSSMNASRDVGSRVLKKMGGVTRLHSTRVENAGFAVLKSADVPSILVETGFITNPGEAKKLNTLSYRTKLAKAIFGGIDSYFQDKPPEGTHIAWLKNGGGVIKHKIERGDTLISIARRYQVSVSHLKKHNSLNSSTIRIGQVLLIPVI